ncbi:MAG: nitrous oxide reductase accessory protein NosL [Campylobacterales bacterium]|nr:nitrous oxide reductase accessory protein NosL [Campylobacterales bacterium]
MKKIFLLLLLMGFVYGYDGCPICGNDLKLHQATHHQAKLSNDRQRHYCSLRCLVVDTLEYGVKDIQVRDYASHRLIDANQSFYVVGSSLQGVHSKISKIAFLSHKEALDFAKQKGGSVKDFKEAFQIAHDSLEADNAYFKTIKTKKIYPMGKKIYTQKCKSFPINLSDFLEIDEAQNYIVQHKLCPNLNVKHFEALSLYLWEQHRHNLLESIENKVAVGKDEKCPVCGMFTYKYPRWATQIVFMRSQNEERLSFDGVKDLMKFYFEPSKWGRYEHVNAQSITKILVTDYYSQKAIDAKSAFYVIGSDIYGPMGHELIPFATLDDAQSFKDDHRGRHIVKFDALTPKMIYELDE